MSGPGGGGSASQQLDWEVLDLGRRAAYRRILAILRAEGAPFVLAGSFALSVYLQRFIDGSLEVFVSASEARRVLTALASGGFRLEEVEGRTYVGVGEHRVAIAWALPPPLGGAVDEAWFDNAVRVNVLDLRVPIAPAEELLWLLLATQHDIEPLAIELLDHRVHRLVWERVLVRLAGLETVLLAHLFLFWHQRPEKARASIPPPVLDLLLDRVRRSHMVGPRLDKGDR